MRWHIAETVRKTVDRISQKSCTVLKKLIKTEGRQSKFLGDRREQQMR